ncbi:MAG: tetratricopeptide repeat protein [Candidatus Coatesbacteria bacterium]|nr:tetratricopeptide repeat protein [Candidatus Coatesbacteria bacterium]
MFLAVSGDLGIKELLAQVADDSEALTEAFTEVESALRDNAFKSLAFYAYVATAHADKPIGRPARQGIPELLLRHDEYKTALNDFLCSFLDGEFSAELHQRSWFGRARCWEGLGRTGDAITAYRHAWNFLPDSELGHSAAERLARIRLDQGNRTEAASWCLQMKSAKPSHVFLDKGLNDLYAEQIASVRKHSDGLVSFVEQEIATRPVPPGEEDPRKKLLTHLGRITEDSAEQEEDERLRALRLRRLLAISAAVVNLLADPSAIAQRAEDLEQAIAALRSGRRIETPSTFDKALLEANDAVITSALREALVKHGGDGMNGSRLAAAYLYYAATRDGGGRDQLDKLVASLSKDEDIEGLDKLYSSSGVREKMASVARSARLFEQAKTEYRELIEQGIASATDAASLKELASKAQSVGNQDMGVRALERICARFANEVDAAELTYLLAEAYFQNQEWAKAKEAFGGYIRQEGKDWARRVEAEYLSAMCDFYARNYPVAAAGLFVFSQKHPASEWASMALRVALDSCASYAASLRVPASEKRRVLLELTSRFPGSALAAEAHHHLGTIHVNRRQEYQVALPHLHSALEGRSPEEAAYYIGLCHQNLGDVERAERWYLKVVRESKGDGPRNWARSGLEMLRQR